MRDLLLGKNALLFTYGVTNSGKTFTMEGPQHNPGIVQRLLAVVFASIREYRADACQFRINHLNGVDVLVRLCNPCNGSRLITALQTDDEAAVQRAASGYSGDDDDILDQELLQYSQPMV